MVPIVHERRLHVVLAAIGEPVNSPLAAYFGCYTRLLA
jgi:hypothetical protein